MISTLVVVSSLALEACSHGTITTTTINASNAFTKGLAAQKLGDFASAGRDYRNAISSTSAAAEPKLVTAAYYDLGVIAEGLGKTTRALSYYRKALAVTPNYTPALFNSGVALTPTDPHSALESYDKILAIEPNDPNTLYNAGLLEYRVGNLTVGRTMIKHAITEVPSLASKVPSNVDLNP